MVYSPVMDSGYLSEEDKQLYLALVHRRTLTANMLEEIRVVADNAKTVQLGGVPVATPMLFFLSQGKEVGFDGWRELMVHYIKELQNGKYQFLEAGHYLHHHEPLRIVEQMKDFLDGL